MGDIVRESGERVEDLRCEAREETFAGLYKNRRFVYVYGENSRKELSLLGSYGTEYRKFAKKDVNRMGTLDRQIIEQIADEDETHTTILTLHEAFFLLHALGRIAIRTTNSEDSLSLTSCWELFRNSHKKLNSAIDFAVEYAVYYYFRSRGWIVKDGMNFGVDFVLYKSDPEIVHAQYAVRICICNRGDRSGSNKWITLLTFHRVAQSVGKELLITYVTVPDLTEASLDKPDCIQIMSIDTRSFKANANTPARSVPSIN